MTFNRCALVIASLLAFETIILMPTTAPALEIPTATTAVCIRDRSTCVDGAYILAKKLPGRRQGAGSL